MHILLVLLAASLAVAAGMGALIWNARVGNPSFLTIPVVMATPIAGAFALVGIWHHVLFSHLPESRKPDAVRIEGPRVLLPRTGVELHASVCVKVLIVARPDPPGLESQFNAVREEIRLMVREGWAERSVVAVPYGSRLTPLAERLGGALGVPVERVQGPAWSLDEVRGTPPR